MLFRRFRINFSDGFSFGFLAVSVVSVFIFEVLIVLPEVEKRQNVIYTHIVLGTFVFFNILGNLAKVILTETSTKRIMLPSLLKPLWHFCSMCEANAPPRTHHCDRCNCCILKRDHHCAFAGRCIGLKNFRFFLVFLLYLSLGCFYASMFNMCFIWDYLGGFSLYAVVVHIVPFVFFIFGYLSLRVFIYTLLSVLALISGLMVFNLFILHARQMLSNQTTFERNNSIRTYDLGWKRNIVECLGERWYMILISPFFESVLPSDGLSFSTNVNSNTVLPETYTNQKVRHRHI